MTEYELLVHGKPHDMRGIFMKTNNKTPLDDELRLEYDETLLKNGVRGKYVERYRSGTNLALLAPDVATVFPNDEAVNEALRLVIRVTDDMNRLTKG